MGIFTKDMKSMEDLLVMVCRTSTTPNSRSSKRFRR